MATPQLGSNVLINTAGDDGETETPDIEMSLPANQFSDTVVSTADAGSADAGSAGGGRLMQEIKIHPMIKMQRRLEMVVIRSAKSLECYLDSYLGMEHLM